MKPSQRPRKRARGARAQRGEAERSAGGRVLLGRAPLERESGERRRAPLDRFREECGVMGIAGHPEAANLAYLGLYALQHRGQESAGIVSRDGGENHIHKGMGLVAEIFSQPVLATLPGRTAIGHVRYSTAGESSLRNAQPFLANTGRSQIAVAHNGNLTNARLLREQAVLVRHFKQPRVVQYLRITVGLPEENQRLLVALDGLL